MGFISGVGRNTTTKALSLAAISTAVVLMVLLCTEGGEASKGGQIDAGQIVSATQITTSWNDTHHSKIVTTKGTFHVNAVISAMYGAEVRIDRYDNGKSFLCVEGLSVCRRIVGM